MSNPSRIPSSLDATLREETDADRNDGGGRFHEVAKKAGLHIRNRDTLVPLAKSLGVAFADVDRDGWIDIIVANDVSHDSGIGPGGVMGGDRNRVRIVSASGVEEWPEMNKDEVAERLAALVAERLTRQ
jgi:hypothetical protein